MNGTWKKGPGTELFTALEKVCHSCSTCSGPFSGRHAGALSSIARYLAVLQHCLYRGATSWVPCRALVLRS